jgi:hypothetical protein
VSEEAKSFLFALAIAGGLAAWWAKENWADFVALAYVALRAFFYLAVIVIGIYCLTRLL